jgi:hypothetical protein
MARPADTYRAARRNRCRKDAKAQKVPMIVLWRKKEYR